MNTPRTHIMMIAAFCMLMAPKAQAAQPTEKKNRVMRAIGAVDTKIKNIKNPLKGRSDSITALDLQLVQEKLDLAKATGANWYFAKAKTLKTEYLKADPTMLFLLAGDAFMKLYCWKNADKYSESVTPEIRAEVDNILRHFGKYPQYYDVKFISTPTFQNMYSFSVHDKKINRTTIYLDKVGLHNNLYNTTAFKLELKERIGTALTRPFVGYELTKAAMPLLVRLVLNRFDATKDSILNSTYTANVGLAIGINNILNYARPDRLTKYMPNIPNIFAKKAK